MSNDPTKKEQEQQADGDDSLMNEEELESVSGGCEWGDTMYPKLPDTSPPPFIDPMIDGTIL